MAEDPRQRYHDALADALGECVNCGSPTALHCICGPYGTSAVLERLTDAALATRDSELEQAKDDALAVVAESAQERDTMRERAESAEAANARVRALHPSREEADTAGNALCVECAQPAPCRTRQAVDNTAGTEHG